MQKVSLQRLSAEEYNKIFEESYIFRTREFCELNADKADEIIFLGFKDTKWRLGIIFGLRNNLLLSPFSAPAGGFSQTKAEVSLFFMEQTAAELRNWVLEKSLGMRITFPPVSYDSSTISKWANVLWRLNYQTDQVNLNYYFDLIQFNKDEYQRGLRKNARKNLNNALKNDLIFTEEQADFEKKEIYEIIALNRKTKGYQLRMSWEQVLATFQVVKASFFSVRNSTNELIAGAIVFQVDTGIAQIIYWGDNPAFSGLRPVNFLAFELQKHYSQLGFRILDVGISTEDSIPNYGLCDFKESIGCKIDLKNTFSVSAK